MGFVNTIKSSIGQSPSSGQAVQRIAARHRRTFFGVCLSLTLTIAAAAVEDYSLRYRQALSKFQNADFENALKDFQFLLEHTGRKDFHYYIGYCHLKLGRNEKARQHLQIAVENKPDSWEAQLGLARALFHGNDLTAAEKHLRITLSLHPQTAEADYYLGLIRQREGRNRDAIHYFEVVYRLDPYHAGALYNLGRCYLRLKERGKAEKWIRRHEEVAKKLDQIESLRKAASFPSSTAANWMALGNAYLGIDDYSRALTAFQKAQKISGATDLNYHLGYAYFKLKDFKQAIHRYRLFLQEQPDHFQALYNLGHALRRSGRSQEAIDVFEKAVRLRPDDPTLRIPVAEIELERKDWNGALASADQINRDFPSFPHGFFIKALALTRLGRHEEALISAGKAVALDGRKSIYHLLLSQILGKMGRTEESRREYRISQKLDENKTP